jgi:hypothetical protein
MATRLSIFVLACAAILPAQTPAGDAPSAEPAKPSIIRRFSFLVRIDGIMSNMLENRVYEVDTTSPTLTTKYETKQDSSRTGIGVGVDYRISPNLILGVDYLHHSVAYTQTTTITDANSKNEIYKEWTRAAYWDLPVRLQVFGLRHMPRRMFLSAGGVLRRVENVRTGNDTTYIDGSTAYDENPTSPAKHTIKGALAGFGFRFVDDYGIKLVPEVRYTYWSGSTFNSYSTKSRNGQLEVMIGIGF